MKNLSESAKQVKNEEDLSQRFSQEQILTIDAMSRVRGGDADGSDPLIIIPPKP
jgi:hypothetical protein